MLTTNTVKNSQTSIHGGNICYDTAHFTQKSAARAAILVSWLMAFALGFFVFSISSASRAEPEQWSQTAPQTTAQMMAQPSQMLATQSVAGAASDTQNPLSQPSPSTLEQANQALLTKNAKLEQDINTLQTQVNVLIAERNNQLFMYGAILALVAVLVGFIAAWVLLGRKQNW